MSALEIPAELLPSDGRFGCGPAKIRDASVTALATRGAALLGTSDGFWGKNGTPRLQRRPSVSNNPAGSSPPSRIPPGSGIARPLRMPLL